jgi:hypothetical protein
MPSEVAPVLFAMVMIIYFFLFVLVFFNYRDETRLALRLLVFSAFATLLSSSHSNENYHWYTTINVCCLRLLLASLSLLPLNTAAALGGFLKD